MPKHEPPSPCCHPAGPKKYSPCWSLPKCPPAGNGFAMANDAPIQPPASTLQIQLQSSISPSLNSHMSKHDLPKSKRRSAPAYLEIPDFEPCCHVPGWPFGHWSPPIASLAQLQPRIGSGCSPSSKSSSGRHCGSLHGCSCDVGQYTLIFSLLYLHSIAAHHRNELFKVLAK